MRAIAELARTRPSGVADQAPAGAMDESQHSKPPFAVDDLRAAELPVSLRAEVTQLLRGPSAAHELALALLAPASTPRRKANVGWATASQVGRGPAPQQQQGGATANVFFAASQAVASGATSPWGQVHSFFATPDHFASFRLLSSKTILDVGVLDGYGRYLRHLAADGVAPHIDAGSPVDPSRVPVAEMDPATAMHRMQDAYASIVEFTDHVAHTCIRAYGVSRAKNLVEAGRRRASSPELVDALRFDFGEPAVHRTLAACDDANEILLREPALPEQRWIDWRDARRQQLETTWHAHRAWSLGAVSEKSGGGPRRN